MGDWSVAEEKPAGDSWSVASEKPAVENLSLAKGLKDLAVTGAKSVAGLPALMYGEVRHPIDSAKTVLSGVKNIPGAMKKRAEEDIDSVREDVKQRVENPDDWQKFLRGGRAALTTMASPLDILVGVPYEETFGKVVDKTTGGRINPREAAFLPELATGAKAIPKGVKAVDAGLDAALAKKYAGLKPVVRNPETQARDVVAKRFEQGEKAGAPSLKNAIETVRKARESGKPMTLADVGGENVKGLAGYVARQPGEGRDVARAFLTKRDEGAPDRLTGDVNKHLAKGSALQTADVLAQTRSEEGKPLFEKAYQGGSMAPLEHQFEKSFNESASVVAQASKDITQHLNKITQLKAKLATTNDVYSRAGLQTELKQAEAHLGKLESDLHLFHEEKTEALNALRGAQADKTANAPGAVWNPRIARLMKNPNMKKGLSKGVRIERNLADAEGRRFNPHEYAITGFTPEGEPIVGKVPNMRLLASAKEGLDDLLGQEGMRDKLTGRLTKEGVSVDKLRRSLIKELDDVNPDYKEARGKWAGHSRSMEALQWGRDIFKGQPEELAADMEGMSPAERDFARLGAADIIREKILRTGFHGDEAKAIIKSPWMKQQLRPLFESDESFRDFVQAVTDERTMFESRNKLIGNSATQERAAEDASNDKLGLAVKTAKGVTDLYTGRIWNTVSTLVQLKKDLGLRQNPQLNEAIAKLLFDPNVDLEKINLTPGKK